MKKYSRGSGKRVLTRAKLEKRITRRNKPTCQSFRDMVSSCRMTEKLDTVRVNRDKPSKASKSGKNHSKKLDRNLGALIMRKGLSFCEGSKDKFAISTEAMLTWAARMGGWFRRASMTSGLGEEAEEFCRRRAEGATGDSRGATLRILSVKEVINSSLILMEWFGFRTKRYLKSVRDLRSWICTVSESWRNEDFSRGREGK